MAENKKNRPLSFPSNKNTWTPGKKSPAEADGCVTSLGFKSLVADTDKTEADNRSQQEDVSTPGEQLSQYDTQDDLDQQMGACGLDTEVNKAEEIEENRQQEDDDDDVFIPGETTDEKETPVSNNAATQSTNRNRPATVPKQYYNTVKPKRSSMGGEGPKDSVSLKKWRQDASKKIDRNCDPGTEVNAAGVEQEYMLQETDDCDQPDSAPQTLQSTPVCEALDEQSTRCEPGTEVNTASAGNGIGGKETGAEGCNQQDTEPQALQSNPASEVADQASVDLGHEIIFRDLSDQIGRDWEKLATYLGVSEKRLEYIKMNHPQDVEKQIYYMLMKWRSLCDNFGSSSFLVLANQLERIGQKPLAENIRGQFKH
ncbi:uncharacterized protein LOC117301543 isoform X2 [Asterias rubens]|uniref:uncharacterized protein LOC117301543 isoform X2 n=1 Tax=Asterias rubens TaxID=7604 RepID=UPI001455D72F|nr:uncharacterized protein LOC117301543 isoform X2 [Asterias rubens]